MTEDRRRPGGMRVTDAVDRIVEARSEAAEARRLGRTLVPSFADRVEEVLVDLLRDHGVEVERT